MRRALLLLLCLYPGLAVGFWTGVALEFSNYDSDWRFDGDTREAQISNINFQIEEKTRSELRVGASIGYFDMRLVADSPGATRKYDGEFFSIYLRQPWRLGKRVSLHGMFKFRYNSGRESGSDEPDADLDWIETTLKLGVGFRLGDFRVMPFTAYQDIDGDVSDERGTDVFEMKDGHSVGLGFDYFVEETAFIRLEVSAGGEAGGYLSFVRQY